MRSNRVPAALVVEGESEFGPHQCVGAAGVRLGPKVGDRIRRDILAAKPADYGDEIVRPLSEQLSSEFGCGFGRANLHAMVRFDELFSDAKAVGALSAQLGWCHFVLLLRCADPLERDFYSEMSRGEPLVDIGKDKQALECGGETEEEK